MLQNLKKIFRVDLDILAGIILGHYQAKIAHLGQKNDFLGNFT